MLNILMSSFPCVSGLEIQSTGIAHRGTKFIVTEIKLPRVLGLSPYPTHQ